MIIGLTGGIGTGKSAASKELKAHGYEIIDADEIYAEACMQKSFRGR